MNKLSHDDLEIIKAWNPTNMNNWIKTEEQVQAEEEITKALPSDFSHISDLELENLVIEPLPTGFKFLDERLFLKRGRPEIIIIGARPGQGKSMLLLQVAHNVSKAFHVAFVSLEMSINDLKTRLLAPIAGVTSGDILKGRASPRQLKEANDQLKNTGLKICANFKSNINSVKQSIFDLHKAKPLDLVVIDYAQKLRGSVKQSRAYEIEDIMAQLKELMAELRCPIMLGAQVGRTCEQRGKATGDYLPCLADLKDSGSLEQDADAVLFISRQEKYDYTRKNEADILIAKNRAVGMEGKTIMKFNGEYGQFVEAEIRPKRY